MELWELLYAFAMALNVRTAVATLALACVLSVGCSKSGSVTESRPLTAQFDGYRTGAVEVDPAGLEGGQKGSEELLGYIESELKNSGVLTPLSVEQGAQLIVRVRHGGNNLGEEDVRVIVDFIDAKNHATFGQISVSANGLGEKGGAQMRRVALAISSYMKNNRHVTPVAKGRRNDAPTTIAPPVEGPVAGVVTSGACKTTCTPDASSSLPPEDQTRLAETFAPMLKEMRGCLDRINADSINPVIILRCEPNGLLSQLKVDTGGYDDLACMHDARSKVPQFAAMTRGASVRCEYRCAR